MGELRQYHPSLKVSSIKELPKGDFLIIGDSIQDVIILQNETKMKAALGQKVKISLPKTFQTSKAQNKRLVGKGVPTDIPETEFKEFLGLDKIKYAKAERLTSKKVGRVLPIFQLDTVKDPDETEATPLCNRPPESLAPSIFSNPQEILYAPHISEFFPVPLILKCPPPCIILSCPHIILFGEGQKFQNTPKNSNAP